MSLRRRWNLFAVAAMVLGSAPFAQAQRITLGGTLIDANHGLLRDPLIGGAGRVSFRVGRTPVLAHVGAEWATSSASRTGVMCFGMVLPGDDCPEETVTDRAGLWSFVPGLGLLLVDGARFRLAAMGSLHIATVSVETRGHTTGRRESPSVVHGGVEMGVDAAWTPWRSLPVALEVGISTGQLNGQGEVVLDGYSPFAESFSMTRLRIGAAWQPRPRGGPR
jgi:hypothetical protein